MRFVPGDVRDPASCAEVVAAAIKLGGGLDVLCCNAGIFPSASLCEMTPEQLEEVLAVNLKGTFFAVQARFPALQESGHGRVIVTSSITGPDNRLLRLVALRREQGRPARIRPLRRTGAGQGAITVNADHAGQYHHRGPADLGPEYMRTMEASIPLGRLGSIEDIGNAAVSSPATRRAISPGRRS